MTADGPDCQKLQTRFSPHDCQGPFCCCYSKDYDPNERIPADVEFVFSESVSYNYNQRLIDALCPHHPEP